MLELNRTYLKAGWMAHKVRYPQPTLTAILKGTFDLRNGGRAVPAKEQFEITGDGHTDDDPAKNMRYSSDFVPFKPRTDVLLAGHCHAPGGVAVEMLPVSFSVGNRSKRIVAIGDSYSTSDFLPAVTRPEPFASLPISYENSYGGPGFEGNPIGKGYVQVRRPNGSRAFPRPNFELPGDEGRTANAPRDPVGFGPIPLTWPQRLSRAGIYDEAWLRERWPWFPANLDWSFFNAAPLDQQFEPYLRGNEKFCFENLHPQIPFYECSLPAVRVRCFYADVIGAPISFCEVPLELDTVWIDLDAEKAVLVWRGVTNLRNENVGKRDWLVVAVEELAENPKPIDYYEALARRQAEAIERAELPPAPKLPEPEDPVAAVEIRPLDAAVYVEQYARGQSFQGQDLTGVNFSGRSLPGADFRDAILTDALFRRARLSGANFAGAILAGADLTGADLEGASLCGADLTGARMLGARLNAAHLERADLSRANLREATLEGVHAEKAIFQKADLFRAVFRNACLNQADLSGTELHDADFSNATLVNASLEEAVGFPIIAESADLSGLRAADAVLWESNFRNVTAVGSMWQRAQLRKSIFVGADLTGAEFDGATLPNADFSGAVLRSARLVATNLRGARFDQADLFDGSVEQADLTLADFSGANLFGVKSFEAVLDGVNFSRANLKHTVFEAAS